ncbi:hypothetical protein GA0070618_4442 [Micromonospora echinospora]|uniref:Uncharacterized protein n=1 Tax=Micromonospora echinospora TaxID=1877 RepID=A0A1C4YVF7_MICEC|nr:hypothetical protein GA0070618_4442 [Micromonospora echinospora]
MLNWIIRPATYVPYQGAPYRSPSFIRHVFVLCAGGLGGLLGGGTAAGTCLPIYLPSASSTAPSPPRMPGVWPAIGEWDGDQVANAAAIVTTGTQLGVPGRGWVIAVATAMQESSL